MTEKIFRSCDADFESRNWLLLVRLSKMGYPPDEALELAHKISSGEIEMDSVPRKGETK